MAVAALVLGILGTLCSITTLFIPGLLLSIVALVLGIFGRKQAAAESKPTGLATAGMVLGIVGTTIGALIFAACAACIGSAAKVGKEVGKQIEQEQKDEQARQARAMAIPAATMNAPVDFIGDSRWVVTDAKDRGKTLTGAAGKAQTTGRFIQVTFKITNLTKKEDSLLDLPAIVDSQGRELKPYEQSASYLPPGAKDLAMAPLPPSIAKEFVEIYEVPADAQKLRFRARALAPLGDTRLVDLGL